MATIDEAQQAVLDEIVKVRDMEFGTAGTKPKLYLTLAEA
jgi:hypothetical protein